MKLKEIRERRRMTQQQMADFLGLSQPVYAHYENGARQPSIEMLKHLSQALCVSVDYIIENERFSIDGITPEETQLIVAYRMADERARQDALSTLLSHPIQKKENVG